MRSLPALVAAVLVAAVSAPGQDPRKRSVEAPRNVPVVAALKSEMPGLGARLRLTYGGREILWGSVTVVRGDPRPAEVPFRVGGEKALTGRGPCVRLVTTTRTGLHGALTQTIELTLHGGKGGDRIRISGWIRPGHAWSHAVETGPMDEPAGPWPEMQLVRNVVGHTSRNLRNNAVYCRERDWLLAGPGPFATRITPPPPGKVRGFGFRVERPLVRFTFRPHFYRRHKNIPHFEPWTYRPWTGSVTGWCSWWPYRAKFCEKDLDRLLKVFREKRLRDFGYRYIQIDDTFQQRPGEPETWLEWNAKFPGGIDGYVDKVRGAGFEAGIWIGAMFHDCAYVSAHPEMFIPGVDGKPLKAPWLGYGVDPTAKGALETLVRPIHRALRRTRFTYLKLDTLRHLLYDAMYHARGHFEKPGMSVETAFRRYLTAVREEFGRDRFFLACWGVLPEAVGIADACRLGTDGFGAAKLQQYNSWNGIVWRNDPDHCDVLPTGGDRRDAVLRPALVSMAGAVLMLSDRAEVYEKDEHLEGIKRASPVLFTVPGQVYDVDPVTSDNVVKGLRPDTGAGPGPIDARHGRPICPWWMLEVNRPFESWTVLGRFNFAKGEGLGAVRVSFRDLGLEAGEHIVYEFRTGKLLGTFRSGFEAPAQPARSVRLYAIRERRPYPQVVSTSRHISQGGVDLESVHWRHRGGVLTGRSRVVKGDPYLVTIHVPERYRFVKATVDGEEANHMVIGEVLRLIIAPETTGRVAWKVEFAR